MSNTVNKVQVLDMALALDEKVKGNKQKALLLKALSNAMSEDMLIETDNKQNIGRMIEAFLKCYYYGYKTGYMSRSNKVDLTLDGVEVEVKVSASVYSLSAPLTKVVDVIFFSENGVHFISKEKVALLLSKHTETDGFVKYETGSSSPKLKPSVALRYGVKHQELSKVFGL